MLAGKFEDAPTALAALTAGNATVTLVSRKTNARYTFKVRKARGNKPVFFVSLLTGPCNETDFNYIGILGDHGFRTTAKSKLPRTAAPVVAFGWSFAKLAAGTLPDTLEVWHEGHCCRCGRKLTVPGSLASALGPECAKLAA